MSYRDEVMNYAQECLDGLEKDVLLQPQRVDSLSSEDLRKLAGRLEKIRTTLDKILASSV